MANNPTLLTRPLAEDGQMNTIPDTTDATSGLFSQQYGWQSINSLPLQAGGKAVKREDFNGAFNLLGGIAFMAQKGFTFKWSATQDYYAGCVVIDDTDGLRYECIADVTANDTAPSADTTHWQIFSAGTDLDAWFRQPSTQYGNSAIALLLTLPTGWYLECTGTGGITSASDLVITSPNVGDTITDGTVVWTIRKIGSGEDLTVVDSIAPASNQGSVAEIINGVANMLKQIKGDSDWKTAPVISLASILSSLGTNFEVTTDETTGVFSVPALGITGLMAQNGYISLGRLFGGLILQWGLANVQAMPTIGDTTQITLPIAFTSINSWACTCSTLDAWAAGTFICGCSKASNSIMRMAVLRSAGAATCCVTWIAMGY